MRDGKIKLEGWKSNWKVWNQTGRWQVKSDCCCGIRNTTNNQCPTWKTHILCVVQLQIGRWFNQGCFNAPLLLQQWEELSVIQHTHTHTLARRSTGKGGGWYRQELKMVAYWEPQTWMGHFHKNMNCISLSFAEGGVGQSPRSKNRDTLNVSFQFSGIPIVPCAWHKLPVDTEKQTRTGCVCSGSSGFWKR